jgi:hypothetical protein
MNAKAEMRGRWNGGPGHEDPPRAVHREDDDRAYQMTLGQPPTLRFTIRGFMIAVLVIAVLLALPGEWRVAVATLSPLLLPCLAVVTAQRLLLRGRRRPAGICFWVPAVLVNLLFAVLCIDPGSLLPAVLFLVGVCVVMPTLAGFGVAWAILATRIGVAARRSPAVAWLSVIVLAVMPVATAWTLWPFRLVFLTAKPSMERLANQVASGKAVGSPRWVGPFRVAGSAVDPATGNVALLIDPNPNGPTGFIRDMGGRSVPYDCFRPIRGDWLHVDLGGGWCYHEED